jgi:aminoglycoside phosphotransferase (APT) family kinase protein
MTQSFNQRVERYFGERLGWEGVRLLEARKLTGGISRETWRISLQTAAAGGEAATREIVLRLDPPVSLLESNRDLEYAVLGAFDGFSDVPVPRQICNEPDASYVGASFMAVDLLPGVAEISAVTQPPFAAVGRQIALAHFTTLGAIARFDYRQQQLDLLLKAPTAPAAALDALLHWESVLRAHSLGPAPITEAAIRHLKRHPPPPAQRISVVHGDYRLGNCLYLPDGTIAGVLDWEMVHLGDPLEDLAWAMHPSWRPSASPQHLVAGYLTEEETVQSWQDAARLRADRGALRWWRLFSCLKAAALFTTGAHNFLNKSGDPVYALSAWTNLDSEEGRMLDWLGVRP